MIETLPSVDASSTTISSRFSRLWASTESIAAPR
jgi:hypothetical protein